MDLPADTHVHSEWSWDTGGPSSPAAGTMQRSGERAVRIGLPALAFTEHLDLETDWVVDPQDLVEHQRGLVHDGRMRLPVLDVAGYLDAVGRLRRRWPDLQVLTGVEFGQPHRYWSAAASLTDLSVFQRVNGSLHTVPAGDGHCEPITLYRTQDPADVMNAYLAEMVRMAESPEPYTVVTHIDYAVRSWPVAAAGPFDPLRFEDGFRTAMRAIARSGRALEMNTRRLWPWVPQWWAQEGGRAVSFGSDAHIPDTLADHFPEAVAMVAGYGFRPGLRAADPWTR